jgi:hypothetical protein
LTLFSVDGSVTVEAPAGASTYLWELISDMEGSTGVLATPTAQSSTIDFDVTGSYIIRLTVDALIPAEKDVFELKLAVPLANSAIVIPAAHETTQDSNFTGDDAGFQIWLHRFYKWTDVNASGGPPDLSDYWKLSGRAGGQVGAGGTGVTDSAIIKATTGAGVSGSTVELRTGNDGIEPALVADYLGRVGLGTETPLFRLTLDDDGGIYAAGVKDYGTLLPPEYQGAGVRMMWYPRRMAFRAGATDGTEWDEAQIGRWSVAMGRNTIADSDAAIALGEEAEAYGRGSIAAGYGAYALNTGSVALGFFTEAKADYAFATGYQTDALGSRSTAMGGDTIASGSYSLAVGLRAESQGLAAISLGQDTIASGLAGFAGGYQTEASGDYSTAFGQNTEADGDYSTAFGHASHALGETSAAFGHRMRVSGDYSFGISLNPEVLGYDLTQDNTMSIMGGKVGIGVLDPSATFEVNGTTLFGGDTTISGILIGGDGTTDSAIVRATSGIGAAGSTVKLQVGNNGAIDALSIDHLGASTFTGTVDISSTLKIQGGSPGVGKVFTSDAVGLGSWETPSAYGSGQVDAESEGANSTSSTTYQTKLTLTTPSLTSGKYKIEYQFEFYDAVGDFADVQVLHETTEIAFSQYTGRGAFDENYSLHSGFYNLDSISGVNNFYIKYRASGFGSVCYIRRARLNLIRVS